MPYGAQWNCAGGDNLRRLEMQDKGTASRWVKNPTPSWVGSGFVDNGSDAKPKKLRRSPFGHIMWYFYVGDTLYCGSKFRTLLPILITIYEHMCFSGRPKFRNSCCNHH